ncbi:MAG: hypothetical protein JXR91_12985 [Deltaproteobacteria bacterium]|nr:hypothetical protein [Deltaproteobacteria bacterium]
MFEVIKPHNLSSINSRLLFFESKITLLGFGVLLGTILLSLAALYVTPTTRTLYHGELFQHLSTVAFSPEVPSYMRVRILTPALSQLVGLNGENYIFIPIIMGMLLLTSVYCIFRMENFSPFIALNVAALVAFSSPIITMLKFPGYVDTTTYLMLLWSVYFARLNKYWWVIFLSLALLNHELSLFMTPFIWLTANRKATIGRMSINAFLVLLALVPFLFYRRYIESIRPEFLTTMEYFDPEMLKAVFFTVQRFLLTGIFMSFRAFWAIPILAIVFALKAKETKWVMYILSLLGLILLQIVFATDTSRLFGMAFIMMVVAVFYLNDKMDESALSNLLSGLFVVNLLLPNFVVMPHGLAGCSGVPWRLLLDYLNIIPFGDLRWI